MLATRNAIGLVSEFLYRPKIIGRWLHRASVALDGRRAEGA